MGRMTSHILWKVIEFHGSKPPTTLDWFKGTSTGKKQKMLGKNNGICFFFVPVNLPV
jgi:hypothetical protein